jgi:hypothetical protein
MYLSSQSPRGLMVVPRNSVPESSGYGHSVWISFRVPRTVMSRDLLTIFIPDPANQGIFAFRSHWLSIVQCSWDSLSKEHSRLSLFEVSMGQIRSIYNRPKLPGHLTKYDSLLGLMDRMGPQTQSWACMGYGSNNFPNKLEEFPST